MKKKVLYLFFLVLYLLIACTMLSRKIEDEMAVRVQVTERSPISGSSSSMTLDPLFYENGVGMLYEVTEGTGWSSGQRTTLVPEERWSYEAYGRFLQFVGGRTYWFVETASRQPADGGQVKVIETFETGEDQYLLLCPEGIPDTLELPETWTVTARAGDTMLLDIQDGTFPFFQHRARLQAGIPREESSRIISLTEAQQFLEALPSVTMAALILAAGVVIWAFSCFLGARAEENKPLIGFNLVAAAVLLCALSFVLQKIDLPASMLPANNILDWEYYSEKFSLILGSMESLANGSHSIITSYQAAVERCGNLLRSGTIAMLVCLLTEGGIMLGRNRRLKKDSVEF